MNVYDYAHSLAKAIKSSPDYKNFKKCHEKLEKDQSAKDMLADFRKNQWELQKQKMSGIEVAPEQEQRLSRALEIINLNMTVKEYLEAEYRFSVMLADIQKIIGEPLEDLIGRENAAQQPEQNNKQAKS